MRLPILHTDPFDRIFVAQAQAEEMVLVTRSAWIPSRMYTSCGPDLQRAA
ncbi:hypothetical protein NKH18_34890 [Streptomyces sp. M10(2022)]